MPKHATAKVEDMELKTQEPASAQEMERRKQVASVLRSLMDRPMTEAEKTFWREFDTDLEKDRLKFR
jgi:hypothetical protein